MKIIIAGAGAIGRHLAKLFTKEHHDITLIDEDEDKLLNIGANFDLLTLCASPTSLATLNNAEIKKADLFISVMPDEAHNIMSCILANRLGAKKTVARVDNPEYAHSQNEETFLSVGINSIVYPEQLAGLEIIHNIKRSWVRQWIEVQDGELLLICVKVREDARCLDVPLRDFCAPDMPLHVVAIKRHGETLIPHGNDVLRCLDAVYFMTTPKYVPYLREIAGKTDYPDVKNVFFLGGGKTTERALVHLPDYMRAKVFEADVHRIEQLDSTLTNPHIMFIHGDGRDIDLLIEEGIHNAQAFVAATGNSETNVLACLAAKRLGVRKTVAVVENFDYIAMAESLDIGSIINKKRLAAGHIYRMILKADVTTVKNLTVAAADVAEFVVKEGSKVTRRPVKDLKLPPEVTLGGMVRGKEGVLINGNTLLQTGDRVVAFCLEGSLKRLEKYFN